MKGVVLEFVKLDLVVLVFVDLSENCIDILESNREVDLVLLEELSQKLLQLLSVEESTVVLIELSEILSHFLVKVVAYVLKVVKLLDYCL